MQQIILLSKDHTHTDLNESWWGKEEGGVSVSVCVRVYTYTHTNFNTKLISSQVKNSTTSQQNQN